MRVIDFRASRGIPIREYDSVHATAVPLGHGAGEAHAYAVHFAPGARIGPHPAGFDQLFLVVQGSGWVAGGDGAPRAVAAGFGAHIARGEVHAKGSDAGMLAIMFQVTTLALDAAAPSTDGSR